MHISAILFDKDGTLFDFRRTWLPILRTVAAMAAQSDTDLANSLIRAAGYDPDTDRFIPDGPIAAGNSRDISAAWSAVLPSRDQRSLQTLINDASETQGPRSAVPVCDLPALLEELTDLRIIVGLATSDSESGARKTLDRFGITDRFQWISGYDSGYGIKPDPTVVRAFAQSITRLPQEIAVVGDTLHDLHMGRDAGVAARIAVCTGAVPRHELAPAADVVLNSIAELPAFLRRWSS